MTENEEKSKFLTKISCLLFFMLYFGLSTYSAVTAGQNIPNDNTNISQVDRIVVHLNDFFTKNVKKYYH